MSILPMIIMRSGGLDGVALQGREYRYLFNSLDIGIHILTGQTETEFGPIDPIGECRTVIPEMNFFHPDTQLIFANQFKRGSEKKGIARLKQGEWRKLFLKHKEKIKTAILKELAEIEGNCPVFVFNLLSLRHAHPAAAVAIKEIIEAFPGRGFISHSADPDAERPEKISRMKDGALQYISAEPPDQPYSGGPYHFNNLFHIVLNPVQKHNFITKYRIPEDHLFEIPDFVEFKSKHPRIKTTPSQLFLTYLGKRRLQTHGNSYSYFKSPVDASWVFFLSPVRPVYRKRLKESMLIAHEYGRKNNCRVAFVVTHPNLDDRDYFHEVLEFSESIALPYYHLGESFSLQTLEQVYENFACLKTVGVVASSAGGWENALNEMARYSIPFYMNCNLNSYLPLTRDIGMYTHGTNFGALTEYVQKKKLKKIIREGGLDGNEEINRACQWIDRVLIDPEERMRIIDHNYQKAYDYLSRQSTRPHLLKLLKHIEKKLKNKCKRYN